METFLLFFVVGALAQAVDGALGMAYGVISSSVLLAFGVPPAMASASVHGAEVFTISEPGYENALGYQQTATVGAILSNSIRQLDEESKQLGTAIDNLQQLLVSLPKPEPQPEPQPESKPVINRKR